MSVGDPSEFWDFAKVLNCNPASKITAATIKFGEWERLEIDTETKPAFR